MDVNGDRIVARRSMMSLGEALGFVVRVGSEDCSKGQEGNFD